VGLGGVVPFEFALNGSGTEPVHSYLLNLNFFNFQRKVSNAQRTELTQKFLPTPPTGVSRKPKMFNNWPNGADLKSQSRHLQKKLSLNDSLTQASIQKPYNLAGIDIANPNQTDNTFGEYMIDYGIIQNVARRRARSTNINRLVSANSQHKQNVSFGISQDVPSNLKEFASPKRVAHETS
jgi:hypothetical protein